MPTYRRIVSGFSTFRLLVHKTNKLLVKFRSKIIVWVFDHYTAEETEKVVNLMNLVQELDSVLQGGADD